MSLVGSWKQQEVQPFLAKRVQEFYNKLSQMDYLPKKTHFISVHQMKQYRYNTFKSFILGHEELVILKFELVK